MEFSLLAISTLWCRPRKVVLDLRPLQCGYARRGIGRYTAELAPRLKALGEKLNPQGHAEFQFFTLILADQENPIPDIPVLLRAPKWKRPWLWDQLILPFLLLKRRVYVFHNFTALGPLEQISFPVLARRRGIATVHDWHMFAEDAADVEKFYRQTRRIQIQLKGLARVHRIVVDSEQIKVETLLRSVPLERVHVVGAGSDHLDAIPAGVWRQENFALSIGDTPNKNLAFTFAVLTLLRGRYVHLNWVIIGGRGQVLERLGLENGKLPDWITILEHPEDGLLKACYQQALALVFPSTREGFGIPVLEAMRLGCPVLASDLEPMKSVLKYAPGLLPLSDHNRWAEALKRLLYDSTVRSEAVAAGLSGSLKQTWDAAAERLIELYRGV